MPVTFSGIKINYFLIWCKQLDKNLPQKNHRMSKYRFKEFLIKLEWIFIKKSIGLYLSGLY